MPLDGIDKGRIAGETEEMRRKREENTENAPPAEFFKLRAELLEQGRTKPDRRRYRQHAGQPEGLCVGWGKRTAQPHRPGSFPSGAGR